MYTVNKYELTRSRSSWIYNVHNKQSFGQLTDTQSGAALSVGGLPIEITITAHAGNTV